MDILRFRSKQEETANNLLLHHEPKITTNIVNETLHINGKIKDQQRFYTTLAVLDKDQRLINGQCDCSFFQANQFRKGPCEHILATRIVFENSRNG